MNSTEWLSISKPHLLGRFRVVLGPQKIPNKLEKLLFFVLEDTWWPVETWMPRKPSQIHNRRWIYRIHRFYHWKRPSFPVTDPASSISGHYNGFSVHPCRGRGLHIHREARVSFIERLGRSEFRIEIHFGIELNPNFGSRSILGIELNNFGSRSNFGWISIISDRGPISDWAQ